MVALHHDVRIDRFQTQQGQQAVESLRLILCSKDKKEKSQRNLIVTGGYHKRLTSSIYRGIACKHILEGLREMRNHPQSTNFQYGLHRYQTFEEATAALTDLLRRGPHC